MQSGCTTGIADDGRLRHPPRHVPASRRQLALCLVGLARTAHAGERVDLHWDGPASCPSETFYAALERHLGEPADGPPLRVRVQVHEQDGRWTLDLGVADDTATGARQLAADSCTTLVDAAAFIVAQALDQSVVPLPPAAVPEPLPSLPLPQPVPQPLPPEAIASPLASPIASPSEALPPPLTRPRLRGALRAEAGPSGGALPGTGAELGLAVGLLGTSWRVELTAHGRLPVRVAATAPGVGASLAMWAVGARGCGVPRAGSIEFPLCLGAEAGQLHARSFGLTPEGRGAATWAAVTAGPGLMWSPRPWFALTLQLELAIALIRPEFVIAGLPPLHNVGPLQARGLLGVEFRFPGRRIP